MKKQKVFFGCTARVSLAATMCPPRAHACKRVKKLNLSLQGEVICLCTDFLVLFVLIQQMTNAHCQRIEPVYFRQQIIAILLF